MKIIDYSRIERAISELQDKEVFLRDNAVLFRIRGIIDLAIEMEKEARITEEMMGDLQREKVLMAMMIKQRETPLYKPLQQGTAI